MIALRPDRDGTIRGYEGLDELQQRFGEWVIDSHLPPPGTPDAAASRRATWRTRGCACAIPDYDTLRGMLDVVGRNVRVLAG